jgi:hypothetical protein
MRHAPLSCTKSAVTFDDDDPNVKNKVGRKAHFESFGENSQLIN